MKTLTTTKEFMETLFIESDKDEYYTDLFQFLKNEIFGVKLICDFSSIKELTDALTDNPIWEMLMDKYDKINFNPNLDEELNNDEFYSKLNEENMFLTSLTIEQCHKLSKERGYIYISAKDISESWKPIKYIRDNGVFKVTNDTKFPSTMRFDNWDCIDDFCLPLTSIIIFDKYILCDKSNQKLKDNLFVLLDKLCGNSLLKPLHLTIISEFETDELLIKSYHKLEDYFTQKLINNIKLNILRHDKSKYPSDFEGLHYRLIITNNLRIKCDDSFNFFKSNGKINNDADINFSFHMCHSKKCFYEKELDHIKRYVSRLVNLSDEIQVLNKLYYYTDKDNYLFN